MNLKAVLEGLLFVAGDDGLSLNKIMMVLDIDKDELKKLLDELNHDYNSEDRGLKLERYGNTVKVVTKSEHAEYYKRLIGEEVKEPLSSAMLETLAIVAYNEPVTRTMVDEIRGVNCAYLIKKLVFRNFIKEVGRSELPGRPILYGVTEQFLDYFGLKSTKDLPKIAEVKEPEETELFTSKYKEV